MADTWERYFFGRQLTPGEIEAEKDRRRQIDAKLSQVPKWSKVAPDYKMGLYQSADMLSPVPSRTQGEFWGDAGRAAAVPLNATIAALDTFGRGRDAAVRAMQEVSGPLVDLVEGRVEDGGPQSERKMNPLAALGHLASIPSNMAAPLTGAKVVGGYGEPDDWRQYATPGNAMFLDIITDPGNFLTLPSGGAMLKGARSAGRAVRPLGDTGGPAIRSLLEAAY